MPALHTAARCRHATLTNRAALHHTQACTDQQGSPAAPLLLGAVLPPPPPLGCASASCSGCRCRSLTGISCSARKGRASPVDPKRSRLAFRSMQHCVEGGGQKGVEGQERC